jgi:hypothetical protein
MHCAREALIQLASIEDFNSHQLIFDWLGQKDRGALGWRLNHSPDVRKTGWIY